MNHDRGASSNQGQLKTPGGNQHHSQSCSYCGRNNHVDDDRWYKNKNNIQCNHCKKYGHIERNCHKKAREQVNFHEEANASAENLFAALTAQVNSSDEI